jgi:fibronectin type 3 domain-containing protein
MRLGNFRRLLVAATVWACGALPNEPRPDAAQASLLTTLGLAAPDNAAAVPVRHDYFVAKDWSDVSVRWVDNANNEQGFKLEKASTRDGPWSQVGTMMANATATSVGAERETLVCFRVVAFNSVGASNPSAAACTAPPANPTNLTAQPTRDFRALQLTWLDNSAFEDGYMVFRQESEATWRAIATMAANSATYIDSSAAPDVTYYYRVVATRDGGSSDDSNIASGVVPTTRPNVPTEAFASLDTYNDMYGWVYLEVSWKDNSANEEGFRIETSRDGQSSWAAVASLVANTTNYSERWDIFTSLAAGACYRIIAFNAKGESSPSNVTCDEWGVFPGDLAATALDDHAISLSWTDMANYELGYEVRRAGSEAGEYQVIARLPHNSTAFVDRGLASGTEYWYVVATLEAYVPSDASESSSVTAATSSASMQIVPRHLSSAQVGGPRRTRRWSRSATKR